LPFETCLRLIADVPVGRVAFHADGAILVLPVNHVLDGSAVAFRSTVGSKLSAALDQDTVTFEVDHYDPVTHAGWSVMVTGVAEAVVDDAAVDRLERTDLDPWVTQVERPHWIRVRADSVTGRAVVR
nr:pyridoxamine 5'-phosphate oxidase family protein [Micromonospora sp. DSM 115978]